MAVATGSTIRNIAVVRRTRTAQPQIGTEERHAAIPWATGRRMRGRIKVNGATGNETTRQIVVPGTDNSRVTEEGRAGHKRAHRIEAAEERTGSVIDKFRTRRVDRTKVLSVEPRRGRAEVRPDPVASAALPAWEARAAAPETAAVAEGGEGRQP